MFDVFSFAIGGFGGVILSTVIWFFVWRNNKKDFIDALLKVESLKDVDKVSYVKELLAKWGIK